MRRDEDSIVYDVNYNRGAHEAFRKEVDALKVCLSSDVINMLAGTAEQYGYCIEALQHMKEKLAQEKLK